MLRSIFYAVGLGGFRKFVLCGINILTWCYVLSRKQAIQTYNR